MIDILARLIFALAILAFAFLGGFAARALHLWPDAPLQAAIDAAQAYRQFHTHDHPFEVPARYPGRGVTVDAHAAVAPGPTFMVLYEHGRFGARLIDEEGRTLHSWATTIRKVWPEGPPHLDVVGRTDEIQWHGAHLFANGDIAFNFEGELFPYGGGLVRLDKESHVLFRLARNTHHSVHAAPDGTLWVPDMHWHDPPPADMPQFTVPFFEDTVLQVSREGRILREVSITRALLAKRGIFPIKVTTDDPTHLNDVEVVTPELAPAFPMLRAGDLVVSLRTPNAIVAIDPVRDEARWIMTGAFVGQHDIDLLPDGTMMLFDNKGGDRAGRRSRALQIDPRTQKIVWAYAGSAPEPLFSEAWGWQQLLPNGNLLVTETYGGRVLEVGKGADQPIVWQYINRLDEPGKAGFVSQAERFTPGTLTFLGR